MRASVITFPASNCDRDAVTALKSIGVEVQSVWHGESNLPKSDLVVIPGGFSYGDYLRCGAMAAHSPIMSEIKKYADKGGYILGICNGFQVLTEIRIIPGALMRNSNLRFICRDIFLSPVNTDTAFTRSYSGKSAIKMPIAHHDGCYFADDRTLQELKGEGNIAFAYSDEKGVVNDNTNINGSCENIAGVFSKNKRVLGLMPHPERLCEEDLGGTDGRDLFTSLLKELN